MIRSPLFSLGMLALVMALSVMALFHLGAAGTLLFQIGVWLTGQLAWLLWLAGIGIPAWLFWTGRRQGMPRRFWVGLFCLASGLTLFLTAFQTPADQGNWEPLQSLFRDFALILRGQASSAGGLAGSFLYGISASLFSHTGAYVAALFLVFVSLIPLLYEPPEKLRGSLEKRREKKAAWKEAMREEPAAFTGRQNRLFADEDDRVEDDRLRARPGSLDAGSRSGRGFGLTLTGRKPRKSGSGLVMLDADEVVSSGSARKGRTGSKSADGDRPGRGPGAGTKPRSIGSVPIIEADSPLDHIDDQEPQTLTGIDIRAEDIASGSPVPARSRKPESAASLITPPGQSGTASREPQEESSLVKQAAKGKGSSAREAAVPGSGSAEAAGTKSGSFQVSEVPAGYENYTLPRLNLLDPVARRGKGNTNRSYAREQGDKLIQILREFNVEASLVAIHIGPSVTRFEVKPDMGVRVSRISNLQNDIQMALGATDIRIEAPIPGKSAVGIEIPNAEKTAVQMKELMAAVPDDLKGQKLLFALGKDLQGENIFGRLDRMPHLLIAGATGSGKSVCVNSIICSLLMRTRPDDVKLILVDPKKVEFTPYADVPHLLAPVITDSELANKALKVVVEMMDHRYDLFGMCGVRNITAYNAYLETHPEESLKPLPRIVVIIDELADLMLAGAKEVEQSIQRITQLARAAGIHLIVATQRPSVDVITGVIKANIPSRIAFAVSSAVDSRTILDQTGAERLLGYGDMLYLPNGETSATRVQGVFIKDEEVNRVSDFVKSQARPQYDDAFITLRDLQTQGGQVSPEAADPLYNDVKHFVVQTGKASTSLIQRRFSIGYARAARLMDVLEVNGIIGPARGSRPREVLVEQPNGLDI